MIVSGRDFELSNVPGGNKVIGLNGRTTVQSTVKSQERVGLRPGEMVDVKPGTTKMPEPTVWINMEALLDSPGPFRAWGHYRARKRSRKMRTSKNPDRRRW